MNRRQFLGAGAAGAAGAAGLGGFLSSSELLADEFGGDKIRLVCVGSNNLPATTEDIARVQASIKKHYHIPQSTKEMPIREIIINRSPKPGVLIVRVGTYDRPASGWDFENIRDQLDKVYDDPGLTIVTHDAFRAEWLPLKTEPKVPYILASHVDHGTTFASPVGPEAIGFDEFGEVVVD